MADDPQSEPSAAVDNEATGDDPKPMTDDELLTLIGEYSRNSLGAEVSAGAVVGTASESSIRSMTSLEIDRYDALNAYWARPLGNETETSSQVVVPEFRDTVEWIMPELMRIFAAAKTPCVFDPEGPDDVTQAQEETEAVAHVFNQLNEGFFVIHDYAKDALIMRNGYTRVEVEEADHVGEETYEGLDENGVAQLLQDKDAEVIGQREEQIQVPAPLGSPPGTPDTPMSVFDVKLRIKKTIKKILVEALPPEEVRVASGTRSNDLNVCPFVEHKTKRTRSQLIAEGYDEQLVSSLAAVPDNWIEMDALARNVVIDQMQLDEASERDRSQQKITVRNVTIHCDFDGDGISERRQVLIAGDKIVSNDIIEECPVSTGVPKRMAHRHTGISLYDELLDIQLIKTELVRQGLNSVRLSLNPRIGVDWKNASLTDLLTWRSGGVIRTNGPPQQVLFPFTTPENTTQQIAPLLEMVDQWRSMRTGVGSKNMGVDADALQDVTKAGQMAAISSASLKVEMIARLLAEGLKDTFLKIHALLIRHQDQPLRFQSGKRWVETDPRKWRKRTRVSPNVGLGSGNREEARQNLVLLGGMMKEIAQFGLVGPKQGYNLFKMGCALLGYDHPEDYALDPDSPEGKQALAAKSQQPPDPRIAAATIRANQQKESDQAKVALAQIDQQTEGERAQAELAHSALQAKEDRETTLAGVDANMAIKLLDIIAKIVAQQLKGSQENAGAVLKADLATLES